MDKKNNGLKNRLDRIILCLILKIQKVFKMVNIMKNKKFVEENVYIQIIEKYLNHFKKRTKLKK